MSGECKSTQLKPAVRLNSTIKLENIAEMSGFQSKSTFNSCLKTITKVTLSAYRKKHSTNIALNK